MSTINSIKIGSNTHPFSLPYGVCSTAADTLAKTVTVENFSLETGATVIVKFTYANSIASPTLNVNNTGAKPIYRYGTTATSTGTTTTGWVAGAVQMFTYDGTGWIRDYWNNTTYSNASLGQGYVTCSTAEATTAKVATLSSYALTAGGVVSVKFTYAVPASATLNISSKGAKSIYYNGSAIKAGVIKAGDIATFIYSSQYHLIGIDRAGNSGTGITVDGFTINHSNSIKGGSVGSAQSPSHGGTFAIPKITYDAQGHITKAETVNITLPANYSLPTASSSTLGGVKIGSNISISSGTISVPKADKDTAGVTVVYPAASCTTYSSDDGTVTPLAVQKGAKMFAITRPPKKSSTDPYPGTDTSVTVNALLRWEDADGNVKNSKITVEDVTNTKDTSKKANVLVIPAEGGKKMVYGYCTDQTDGTSFIGGVFDASATSYPYASGLAIGGTSGNLLWKGKQVATTDMIPTVPTTLKNPNSLTVKGNGTTSFTYDGSAAKTLNIKPGNNVSVSSDTSGNITISSSYTNTTYSFASGDSNGQIKVTPSGGSAQNVSVTGLAAAAYKDVTDSTSASAISTGTSLVTERDVYYGLPKINNSNSYTRSTTIYAPTSAGTSGYILKSAGSGAAPTWLQTLPVANGGTGATTTQAACDNLTGGNSIGPASIDFKPSTTAGHGGYIDFNFNKKYDDYSTRIWEQHEGFLTFVGGLIITANSAYGTALPTAGKAGRIFFKKV